MTIEEGFKFIEKLGEKLQLEPIGTPQSPASTFSHPIVALAENLIKKSDRRIESWTITEHEEESKKEIHRN